ncbi:MAG: TlpA disulfide reductase family protein [Candidatus Acidiferrales bacterium]
MKKVLGIVAVFVVLATSWWFGSGRVHESLRIPNTSASSAAKDTKDPEAPGVTFKSLDGKEISLASLKGKVVLVNFWATYCEPCQTEIPWLIDFQQKYAARGFTVLGVDMNEDAKDTVAPFVAKQKYDVGGQSMSMNYPILLGSDEEADKFGGLIGLPTSVLISPDGKIVKRVIGIVNRESISKEIESLLPANPAT